MAESLADLYLQLSTKGLDVVEADLAAVQRNAVFAGQAFANLAATSAKGLGDMESRPRLIAGALKVLSGETQSLGKALAGIQGGGGGGGGGGGQSGGFAGGAVQQPGGPSGGGGGAFAGGLAKPASDLDSGLLAGAASQLHNFTLAAAAAEVKTAALSYAMQSPGIKGYAVALANASAVQAQFDASINLERLKGLSTLLASPAFQKTSFLSGVVENLSGFTSGALAAQAKAEAMSQALQSGAAARYGAALAQAGQQQERFQAAVRFEQITAQSGRFAASLDALKGRLAGVAQLASSGFGALTSTIGGFVRSGLSGTTTGERLGLQFQLLSREIASLFLPIIERVVGALQSVTSWFRSLDGPQQAFIGKMLTMAAAGLGVVMVLPKIIGGLQGMAAGFALLSANPFILVVAALGALLAGTEEGRGALGRLLAAFAPLLDIAAMIAEAFTPVVELFGSVLPPILSAVTAIFDAMAAVVRGLVAGIRWLINLFRNEPLADPYADRGSQRGGGQNRNEVAGTTKGKESLEAAWTRFQEAAMRTGQGDIAQRQLTTAQRTEDHLRAIRAAVGAPAPAPIS